MLIPRLKYGQPAEAILPLAASPPRFKNMGYPLAVTVVLPLFAFLTNS